MDVGVSPAVSGPAPLPADGHTAKLADPAGLPTGPLANHRLSAFHRLKGLGFVHSAALSLDDHFSTLPPWPLNTTLPATELERWILRGNILQRRMAMQWQGIIAEQSLNEQRRYFMALHAFWQQTLAPFNEVIDALKLHLTSPTPWTNGLYNRLAIDFTPIHAAQCDMVFRMGPIRAAFARRLVAHLAQQSSGWTTDNGQVVFHFSKDAEAIRAGSIPLDLARILDWQPHITMREECALLTFAGI